MYHLKKVTHPTLIKVHSNEIINTVMECYSYCTIWLSPKCVFSLTEMCGNGKRMITRKREKEGKKANHTAIFKGACVYLLTRPVLYAEPSLMYVYTVSKKEPTLALRDARNNFDNLLWTESDKKRAYSRCTESHFDSDFSKRRHISLCVAVIERMMDARSGD